MSREGGGQALFGGIQAFSDDVDVAAGQPVQVNQAMTGVDTGDVAAFDTTYLLTNGGVDVEYGEGSSPHLAADSPASVVLLLGAVVTVQRIVIFPQIIDNVYTVSLEVSTDGVAFTPVYGPVPVTATHDGVSVTMESLCFARGTRIATPRGPKPIEELVGGDVVLTATGCTTVVETVATTWDLRGAPVAARPVCIPAGTRGDTWVATGYLTLSACHGVMLRQGAPLVPAGYVPGARFLSGLQRIEYWHVRLADAEAMLVAEGVHCEGLRGFEWPGTLPAAPAVAAYAPTTARLAL